jgi:serine/threonine-protein phosphatase 6 regulatory ankyrin repeat subunit A/serine/threonine-protein phosphatase 6 regulatory ankyrin repeat subunit B
MSKDKFKRIPLHHAIINGNARVASLLLQYGTDWQFPDSSGNTALHYAAGFGQLQCMRLLLEHGADINAHNMWKITPINIAMLCNHVGAVKKLLDHEGVDVNGKDDKGRTLLALSVADLSDSSMVEFAAYLLSKGADPNIPDILGNTILHHLAAFNPNLVNRSFNVTKQEHVANMQQEKDNHMAMLMLILDSGKAELNALNNDKKTPFVVALATDNIKVLEKLSVNVMISKSPELLFNF